MTSTAEEMQRSSMSTRSQSRRQPPVQQLSQIEKSVTHLLVATKQLLETLTQWSRGGTTEGEVSDVYVRLGYEFNIACRAFNAIGVDTHDLGPVPDLLRTILEETLSQEATQASLDRYLPRIRDIIINLLHGLKAKQQRLRQRRDVTMNGTSSIGSIGSAGSAGSRYLSAASQGVSVGDAGGGGGGADEYGGVQVARYPSGAGSIAGSAGRLSQRRPSGDNGDGPELPPRTSSVPRRGSPSKHDSHNPGLVDSSPKSAAALVAAAAHRSGSSRETTLSTASSSSGGTWPSNADTAVPAASSTASTYRAAEEQSLAPATALARRNSGFSELSSLPPAPRPLPARQQDALASLQRSAELERRGSRRFSTYQIQKHLGTSAHGMPMMPPPQNSPIPNRGKDVRESMNAVRTRTSQQLSSSQIKFTARPTHEASSPAAEREQWDARGGISMQQKGRVGAGSSLARSTSAAFHMAPKGHVDDPTTIRLGPATGHDAPARAETLFVELDAASPTVRKELPVLAVETSATRQDDDGRTATAAATAALAPESASLSPVSKTLAESNLAVENGSERAIARTPSPRQSNLSGLEQSPLQRGGELTLFLQYKSSIKKFVLAEGYEGLSLARLQLAFIEKFAWNRHSNGLDLPEIYIQDPASGIRHELEELADVKDRSVLVLNVEVLDEVKRHFDEGLGGLRRVVEGIQKAVDEQGTAIQGVSSRQQQSAKEIASIAAAPTLQSPRISMVNSSQPDGKTYFQQQQEQQQQQQQQMQQQEEQLGEVQALRRDVAVVRQIYSGFVSEMEASMGAVRSKAAGVKAAAARASMPSVAGDSGRAYVNGGKKKLSDESEKIVNRVDEVQDLVEDLRKDVVSRGVRPLPRQLDAVTKEVGAAAAELKRLHDYLRREKPVWTKIWERELQVVCDDRDLLTMQEELAADLQDDLEKAEQTLALVEQATKQQQQQSGGGSGAGTVAGAGAGAPAGLDVGGPLSGLRRTAAAAAVASPRQAKDDVLGAVRALQPNHEARAEAIERAERARARELASRPGADFAHELGSFVDEGKLKKTGGADEADRRRQGRDDAVRKELTTHPEPTLQPSQLPSGAAAGTVSGTVSGTTSSTTSGTAAGTTSGTAATASGADASASAADSAGGGATTAP